MNDLQEEINQSNIKIFVRIRNHPEKVISHQTEESIKRTEKSLTKIASSNTIKPNGKTPTMMSKLRSKSPIEKSKYLINIINLGNSNSTTKTSYLSEDKKYTIFTSTSTCGTLVMTNQPISGQIINETFINKSSLYDYSYSILKDATLLEYEKVYNETHKLDQIYAEQLKDSISNLFLGRNSCCILFGPSEGGKSFTLRGGQEGNQNEVGLLARALGDLLNLVEISKQQSQNLKNKQTTYFAVKMSVYQVYLDQVNDLLSSHHNKSLRIEKLYDQDNNLKTEILDLTKKEIRSKKDYDSFLKEAMQFRKNLAQNLKVNEMKKKSHLIVSIILEKRERINEGQNKTSEKSLDKFAQIDFVELAASNYGLINLNANKKKSELSQCDDLLYKNTSKAFNSICNNIVSASVGIEPKFDSKLTLALKNTLRADSQINFITCVVPLEDPPVNTMKSLKFANWLRNQVHNAQENRDYKINLNFEDSFEEERKVRNVDRSIDRDNFNQSMNFNQNANTNDNFNRYNTINNERNSTLKQSKSINKIQIPERDYASSDEEQEIRQLRKQMKQKYPYIDQNTKNTNTISLEDKETKLKEVEKSLKDLEAKSLEMSRHIENIRLDRSRIQNNPYEYGESSQEMSRSPNINFKSSPIIDYENEKLKQENATIKSDNIIFREDINRLSDLNRHLEEELLRQRNKNLEMAADNERLAQEKIQIKNEIDKLNENVSKVKIQETSLLEQFNQRFMMENKLRDFEIENRTLRDEKQKFEVEFRVLTERHNELNKLYENSQNELNFIKTKQTEEVNNIETKLDKMTREIEILQRENNSLRVNEERLRQELMNVEKQRDNYRDKYQDNKTKNNLLNVKLVEIEDDFRKLMLEKQVESFEKKKEDESKKMKIETKQKILGDMQSRISNYKTELYRQRVKKEEF